MLKAWGGEERGGGAPTSRPVYVASVVICSLPCRRRLAVVYVQQSSYVSNVRATTNKIRSSLPDSQLICCPPPFSPLSLSLSLSPLSVSPSHSSV